MDTIGLDGADHTDVHLTLVLGSRTSEGVLIRLSQVREEQITCGRQS